MWNWCPTFYIVILFLCRWCYGVCRMAVIKRLSNLTIAQTIFYFLWDYQVHSRFLENRAALKPVLGSVLGRCVCVLGGGGGGGVGGGGGGKGGGAYAALKTAKLYMKRLNKTESPIFVLLCVLCIQRQPFRFVILHNLQHFSYGEI